jgi:hypothetical protein
MIDTIIIIHHNKGKACLIQHLSYMLFDFKETINYKKNLSGVLFYAKFYYIVPKKKKTAYFFNINNKNSLIEECCGAG